MSLSLADTRVTTVGDFLALLKPRVMSLVVFTGLAGIVAAPGHTHPLTAFTALLCIAVAAGASGCRVEWSGEFAPAGVPEAEAIRIVSGIYRAGLDRLGERFGS